MPPTAPVLPHYLNHEGLAVPDRGGVITVTHTSVTVGASSTAVLAARLARRYALFINDSDESIYLSIDGTAAALNDGIRLNANGGSYEMVAALACGVIYAICASGSKKLLVTEGV